MAMGEGAGRRLDDVDRQVVRRLIQGGAEFGEAALAVGCSTKTVQRLLNAAGGIKSRSRPRAPLRLSLAEREEISRGLRAGESLRAIARHLGRAPSTVARDVTANGGTHRYRAYLADRRALKRTARPKVAKLVRNPRLRAAVEHRLRERWSPQQIAFRLRQDHPLDPEMWVSHETIYQSLFVQARGALRKDLTSCLRTGRVRRRPHGQSRRKIQGQLRDMVLISERPAEVEDRSVPGHWEGDLIIGKANGSAIATLVERQTRFVMLVQLPHGRTSAAVASALKEQIQTLPEQLRRTLTWDRGKEMAGHAQFTIDTGIQVYFCDPHSPWQRGSNENTNGLLRQYFPKRTDLSVHDQAHLEAVAAELNGRPRQTLGWMKPSEMFEVLLR